MFVSPCFGTKRCLSEHCTQFKSTGRNFRSCFLRKKHVLAQTHNSLPQETGFLIKNMQSWTTCEPAGWTSERVATCAFNDKSSQACSNNHTVPTRPNHNHCDNNHQHRHYYCHHCQHGHNCHHCHHCHQQHHQQQQQQQHCQQRQTHQLLLLLLLI